MSKKRILSDAERSEMRIAIETYPDGATRAVRALLNTCDALLNTCDALEEWGTAMEERAAEAERKLADTLLVAKVIN